MIDQVTTEMDVYREEIFGPVLSVVRADTVDEAIALINANPYGNGTAIFTSSGEAARRFQRGVKVGMIGINVPIPVPMAYYSFGGWKDSLFGDKHIHGPEGVSFYTRGKVVTSRWPHVSSAPPASATLPDGEPEHLEMIAKPRRLRLGSCPDSWGVWFADDPRQTPWDRFLDELAAAGYQWLELGPYGYLPTDPARLRDELGQRGLKVAGGTMHGLSGLHRAEDYPAILTRPSRWPR